MKIIVGLGNPGRDYAVTRHNLGFMVVDEIARRYSAEERRPRFRAHLAEFFVDGEKVILVKPQTYMNLSGTSVREAISWYKVSPSDALVVVDDIDLPFGATRMRAKGGSGGHNGLKSIISDIGTDAFPRLRVGIGRGYGDASRQVLSRFNREEERILPELVATSADCAMLWLREGILAAMNSCNRSPATPEASAKNEGITPAPAVESRATEGGQSA